MYELRPRLRLDGFYFVAVSRLLVGAREGRGMKEAEKDFFDPRGKWSTYYRIWRFFPSGHVFCWLPAERRPDQSRRDVAAVSCAAPASLHRLPGACWGAFCVRAEDADTAVLDASISLRDHRWPRMSPSTVRYRFNLRAAAGHRRGRRRRSARRGARSSRRRRPTCRTA